jgi:hypothetical protein
MLNHFNQHYHHNPAMVKKSTLSIALGLITFFMAWGQETYPARVVTTPNFVSDQFQLFKLPEIQEEIPELHHFDISFGIADWNFGINGDCCDCRDLIVEFGPISYDGFTFAQTPIGPATGSHKTVTWEEAGISPDGGFWMENVKLEVEFGKVGVRAMVTMDMHELSFGKRLRKIGDLRFGSDEDCKKVSDFIEQNGGWQSLDPQVSFVDRGRIMGDFNKNDIKKYVQRIREENDLKTKTKNLLADAGNAETLGRLDEAIEKYEELYALTKDPVIKAKIEELKALKQEVAEANAKTGNKGHPEAEKNGIEDGRTGRTQEAAENFDHAIPRNEMATELDFWGNPIVSKTEEGETKTVSYAGMEVENNEQYRQQMELRQNNAYAREQFELQEAEKRQQVDNENNAIYQQGNAIYQNSLNVESDFEAAKSQLNYGSGDALLKSSAALASTATNAADATTSLAGMGVGLIMKMGENAAKRKAAEEARAERERQRKAEEARIKAAKEALKNTRLKVFGAFPAGELPLSSTTSSGNNLYYFAYAYDANQLTAQSPVVITVPVFAIGKYPDGTWPLQPKIEAELNALVPAHKTICGPFYSPQEAEEVFNSFSKLMSQTQMQLNPIEYKGYNAHAENGPATQEKAKVDFWGNPIKN